MENMVHYYSSTNRDFLFYLSNILIINHLTLKLYKLFNYLNHLNHLNHFKIINLIIK